jgi:FkbM family methyltransferase
LRLAHLFRNVIAFEPHPESNEALRRSAPSNVEVVRHGLSRSVGSASLFLYDSPGHSAVEGSPVMEGVPRTGQIEIGIVPLDSWSLPGKLDLIKIDTEGHELEVLEGARKTLLRDRPRLCIENHSLELRRLTIEFLADIGLSVQIWPDESRRHPTEAGYCVRL